MKLSFALAMLVFVPPLAWGQPGAPDVVRYDASIDTVKCLFGPAIAVARVKPGQIIEANTLDAFGNVLRKPGDTLAMVTGAGNPLTGPFYVAGAEPGDTLVVKVVDQHLEEVDLGEIAGPIRQRHEDLAALRPNWDGGQV